MRLRILSDLHTEFAPLALSPQPADVVILAGDIGLRTRGFEWARKTFPDTPVVYVAGNHEYYGAAIPHLTSKLRALSTGTNVSFLDEDEVVIQGVRFLGATMWTDFALFGVERRDEALDAAQEWMTDFKRIRKSPSFGRLRARDTWAFHRRARAWLRDAIARPHDGPTVVVTHHAPAVASIADKHRNDLLSAAYASDVSDLIDGRVALWAFGHTHHAVDEMHRGTRLVSNQRGYPDEPADGFNPDLVVTV
jgi:3',5'-cyclic AMP phosphodiesterase CpdA